MRNLMPRIFEFLRNFNNGEPTKREALWYINNRHMSGNVLLATIAYSEGLSYETLSMMTGYKHTRDRMRQLVRKGCRSMEDIRND